MIRNLISLIAILGLIYLSFSSEQATSVQEKSDDQFSAKAAALYLNEIAKAPHPIGSKENWKVRDYIVETLRNEGIDVEVQTGYVNSSWKPTFSKMAYVENIVATLKGNDPTAKKVVLAGHYDSVFEGPGAADDGYAVACMIETAIMLKNSPRKNDLELLITDGEEMGLLGAKHYAENNDLSNIGVMLNYEARGNEGPGISFEYSDENAWLIREMKKASKRPIANSLSYEVYKRMPNSSDFTIFKREGVPGINHAFIDGFSYYHNPADNVENISLKSVQHTGENMYLMAKHFLNFDFTTPTKGNASFFNFYGNLISYSAGADIFLLLFWFCVLIYTVSRYLKHEDVSLKNILIGFVAIVGILILAGIVNFGLIYLVKKVYPQYSTFYSYHYYNHEWYLLAGMGLTILVCWWLGSKLANKFGNKSIGLSTALLLLILSIVLYVFIPTGTYIMMFPLAALCIALLVADFFTLNEDHWQFQLLSLGMLSVLIGTWTAFSHSLFLGFSLGALPAAIVPTALFTFSTIGLLPFLWKNKEYLLPILGICLFSYSMVNAHLRSKPTVKAPLKSNLFFVTDRHSGESYWASYDDYINEGHLSRLDGAKQGRLPRHLPYSQFKKKSDLNANRFASSFTRDTLAEIIGTRIKVVNPKRAGIGYIVLDEIENVDKIMIDGQLNYDFKEGASGLYYTTLYGVGLDSMEIDVVKRDITKSVPVYINFNYPEPFLEEQLPANIVRDDGYTYVSELVEF
ncbi:MAG: M20/M25/M40 family metallo-hydrolase [Bacteroidota bacterium]